MTDNPESGGRFSIKGQTGLVVAIAVVVILLVWLPVYRWFFLISLGIAILIAAVLNFWNKTHPVKEAEPENKKPLGLE